MSHSAIVHNFNKSLSESLAMNDEADWIAFYKRIWPEAVTIVRVDKHSTIQTRGIDRMIWLPSNKQILVDEKCRKKWYGDILLEITSVGNIVNGQFIEKKPGWAVDDNKHCDFVAYAIPSANRCFMLPFQLMQMAVMHNAKRWESEIKRNPIDAQNQGYITRSVAVPWNELKDAMMQAANRTFGSTTLELPPAISCGSGMQLEFEW